MDVTANTKKVSMSLVNDVVVTATVNRKITLNNLNIIGDVARELGIPAYATFTYDPGKDVPSEIGSGSRVTFRWTVRRELTKEIAQEWGETYKKNYKRLYGKEPF